MAIIYECPSCGKKLKIPAELVGQTVRCSDCAATFVAEKAAPPPPPTRLIRRDQDDQDRDDYERPSRRRVRRRTSEGGMEAHRGGLVMSFGIISLVLVFLSGGVYVGGTAAGVILGAAGLPVTIIGLVLGILGWMWGGSDLARMSAGYMDPSGRGMTQAGYICGIIGTILNALALIAGCVITVAALAGIAAIGCCFFSAATAVPNQPPGPNRPFPGPPAPGRRSFQLSPVTIAYYLPDVCR